MISTRIGKFKRPVINDELFFFTRVCSEVGEFGMRLSLVKFRKGNADILAYGVVNETLLDEKLNHYLSKEHSRL